MAKYLNCRKEMTIQQDERFCNVEEAHLSLSAPQKTKVSRPSDGLGQGSGPYVTALANKVPDGAGGEHCTQLKLQENGQ